MSGKLERSWSWIRNYRVWDANRKVFLDPENWIEPELRDDKAPEDVPKMRSRPAQRKKSDGDHLS